jgi:hypothetical protein
MATLRLLIVEDDATDAELAIRELQRRVRSALPAG